MFAMFHKKMRLRLQSCWLLHARGTRSARLYSSSGWVSSRFSFIYDWIVSNNHKYTYQVLDNQAKFISEQLEVKIDLDRKKYGKKSFEPAKES